MKLKELLLNGISFNEILKQFSIDHSDIIIKDEEAILADNKFLNKEILKEKICIQGKKSTNEIINFFGTLHYNLINQLAVFELDFVEKNTEKSILN